MLISTIAYHLSMGTITAELINFKIMSKTLQIAAGIVIGLFCWNLLQSFLDRQQTAVRHERMQRVAQEYEQKCNQGDEEACRMLPKILGTQLEELNKETQRIR